MSPRAGRNAHAKVLAGDLQAPEVVNLRSEVIRINKLLTPLEARFSFEIPSGPLTEQVLLWFNLDDGGAARLERLDFRAA